MRNKCETCGARIPDDDSLCAVCSKLKAQDTRLFVEFQREMDRALDHLIDLSRKSKAGKHDST